MEKWLQNRRGFPRPTRMFSFFDQKSSQLARSVSHSTRLSPSNRWAVPVPYLFAQLRSLVLKVLSETGKDSNGLLVNSVDCCALLEQALSYSTPGLHLCAKPVACRWCLGAWLVILWSEPTISTAPDGACQQPSFLILNGREVCRLRRL